MYMWHYNNYVLVYNMYVHLYVHVYVYIVCSVCADTCHANHALYHVQMSRTQEHCVNFRG